MLTQDTQIIHECDVRHHMNLVSLTLNTPRSTKPHACAVTCPPEDGRIMAPMETGPGYTAKNESFPYKDH